MKRYYCNWCGEEVTSDDIYSDYPHRVYCCGSRECEKEIRYIQAAEDENARLDAEEDDYSRYR